MIRKPERIKFIFNQLRGDNALVKTWEELDSVQRSSALAGVDLKAGEVPVVAMVECEHPIVITTQRIVWRTGEGAQGVELDNVVAVGAPGFLESSKHDVRRLLLTTREGQEYLLETEPGKPSFVLWNLLLRIID